MEYLQKGCSLEGPFYITPEMTYTILESGIDPNTVSYLTRALKFFRSRTNREFRLSINYLPIDRKKDLESLENRSTVFAVWDIRVIYSENGDQLFELV